MQAPAHPPHSSLGPRRAPPASAAELANENEPPGGALHGSAVDATPPYRDRETRGLPHAPQLVESPDSPSRSAQSTQRLGEDERADMQGPSCGQLSSVAAGTAACAGGGVQPGGIPAAVPAALPEAPPHAAPRGGYAAVLGEGPEEPEPALREHPEFTGAPHLQAAPCASRLTAGPQVVKHLSGERMCGGGRCEGAFASMCCDTLTMLCAALCVSERPVLVRCRMSAG